MSRYIDGNVHCARARGIVISAQYVGVDGVVRGACDPAGWGVVQEWI